MAESLLPRAISARLGAAGGVLAQVVGASSHAAVSRLQKVALQETLGKAELTAEAKAELGSKILQLQWHGEDGASLLQALAPSDRRLPAGQRRRCAQDYQNFVHYISKGDWDILLGSTESSAKLQILLQTCTGLGLRCPSEPCLKFITSVWLVLHMEADEIRRLSSQQKHVMFKHVRGEFHRLKAHLGDACEHLWRLPDRPLECLRDHASLYHAHFRAPATPGDCSLDLRVVHELDQSYTCRGAGNSGQVAKVAAQASGVSTLSLDSSGGAASTMEKIANMFACRLDALQENQQRMFEFCLGGSRRDGNIALPSLVDSNTPPTLAFRRLPTMSLADVAAQTPHPRRQLADLATTPSNLSLAAGGRLALPSGSVDKSAVARTSEDQAKDQEQEKEEDKEQHQQQEREDALIDPKQLLNNYLDREADKRKIAQSKKADAMPKLVGDGGEAAAMPKAKAKAKAKAKGKGKAGKPMELVVSAKRKAEEGLDMVRVGKPNFAVERSRSQVLCRTGFKGPAVWNTQP